MRSPTVLKMPKSPTAMKMAKKSLEKNKRAERQARYRRKLKETEGRSHVLIKIKEGQKRRYMHKRNTQSDLRCPRNPCRSVARMNNLSVGYAMTLGQGDTGQLGLGPDIMEKTKPSKLEMDMKFVQVCAGGMHTVCLTAQGEVYTFGCNDEGALGRQTIDEDDMFIPGQVMFTKKIVQISAGDSHTAALTRHGEVYIWGTFRDSNGSMGLTPDGLKRSSPHLLWTPPISKITSGAEHLVCLTPKGEIYTTGCAEQGQLGRVHPRITNQRRAVLLQPGRVCGNEKFIDVWAGQYNTLAKTHQGKIFGWGLNNYSQLGIPDVLTVQFPVEVRCFGGQDWACMAGGQHHTLCTDKDGKVYSLGRGDYGRLGCGDSQHVLPTHVATLEPQVTQVSCGTCVSFAVSAEGAAYAWGMGTSLQLGQDSEEDLSFPQLMSGKNIHQRKVISVSGGGQHTVMLVK